MGSTIVSVIIPNFNGEKYIDACLDSLKEQSLEAKLIIVDDCSKDGSLEILKDRQENDGFTLICHEENKGFAAAINTGVRAADTPYVVLLNNDTVADKNFVKALVRAIKKYPKSFSVSALMLQMDKPDIIDDCGDTFCAFGWAFCEGRDKPASLYKRPMRVTSACGGAAIYDRELFLKQGALDEKHFCYLEDVDLGLRARRAGYENYYEPRAKVYHKASASSGSRYNAFKTRLTSGNTLYLIYKNLPTWMIILLFPLLSAGIVIKTFFYAAHGFLLPCLKGYAEGISKIKTCEPDLRSNVFKNTQADVRLFISLLAGCVKRFK